MYCTFNGQPVDGFNPLSVVLTAAHPRYLAQVPPGSQCHAVETDSAGATSVTYVPASTDGDQSGDVTTQDGTPKDITITNDFQTGGLVVLKEVTGAGAPQLAQGPFTFHVSCTFNGQPAAFESDVTIPKGDGTQTSFTSPPVEGIPAGPPGNETTCVVTETDNGGADATPPPVEVTIVPNEDVTVGLTAANGHDNPFSAGTIGLTKTVEGDLADQTWVTDATFTVAVTCQIDTTDASGNPVRATVYSAPVQISAGETIDPILGPDGQPVLLPVGTHCFGQETATGGATSSSIDHASFDDAVVVAAQEDPQQIQELTLTATNVFDSTAVAVTKKVTGSGATSAGDTTFTVEVSCVLDQGASAPTPIITNEAHTIKAGETVTIDGLPVGSHCWALETDTGGAQSTTVDNGSQSTAVELVAGQTAQITVTNTFAAPPAQPASSMPDTGLPVQPAVLGGLALILLGAAFKIRGRAPTRRPAGTLDGRTTDE